LLYIETELELDLSLSIGDDDEKGGVEIAETRRDWEGKIESRDIKIRHVSIQ